MERSGEVTKAPGVEADRGGVVVDLGLRGFVPLSQLSSVGAIERTEDPSAIPSALTELIGRELQVKVIAVDRERDRISLSSRQMQADPRSRIGSEIGVGQDMDATITKLPIDTEISQTRLV